MLRECGAIQGTMKSERSGAGGRVAGAAYLRPTAPQISDR